MSPSSYPPTTSRRRTLWTSFRTFTCFGSSKRSPYIHLSSDSLPLLSEKSSFYPSVPQTPTRPNSKSSPQRPSTPPSPPRLTRWPSNPNLKRPSQNLKIRRSILTPSALHSPSSEVPPPDVRTEISTRSRAGSTPETELVDGLSLVDGANILGAAAGVVGAGFAGASFYEQRRRGQMEGKHGDVESRGRTEGALGTRRDMGTQVGITIERPLGGQLGGTDAVGERREATYT